MVKTVDDIWSRPSDDLVFFVNGKKVIEKHADPAVSLLVYLRTDLRFTGTKLGCGEGGCGACTVMVSKWDAETCAVRHLPVNSCLAPIVTMHECAITTVEGIGSTKTKLHAVQERLAKFHGSQCGFCTPGIVMSMYALLRNNPVPTSEDIDMCLQGNLCRCTGYRPIIAAFQTFTNPSYGCLAGENCCRNKEKNSIHSEQNGELVDTPDQTGFNKYDPTQEVIFPPELLISRKQQTVQKPLKFVGETVTWYRPVTLDQLTSLKEKYPDAPLVVGNTEIGIETWVKGRCFPTMITSVGVQELSRISVNNSGVTIGAACTLADVQSKFKELISTNDRHVTQPLDAILDMLHWFAGNQIRSVAVIGGNIMTASPISDLNPIFMACESEASFVSYSRGERKVIMDQSFFPSYRKTCVKEGEVLSSVHLPLCLKNEYMKAYMQSKRREDDIAIVNAAMKVQFYSDTRKVKKFVAAFGGMAATTVMPEKTMKNMINREWDESLLDDAIKSLREDLPLTFDAPGGMVEYREALAASFFFKFFIYVKDCLAKHGVIEERISEAERSTMVPHGGHHHEFEATQTWQEIPANQPKHEVVGRPIVHVAAEKQATGEAIYLDDMPPLADELFMGFVTSARAHAHIKSVNVELAKASPGFVTWVDYHDVPACNELFRLGPTFAENIVTCVGQVIGVVVADTQVHANTAARLVKINYEDIHPAIITIEDAIKHQSYYKPILNIVSGDAEEAMEKCDHVIEGEIRIGGQEHFYMETQACLVVPKGEDGEMEIYASTQSPTMLQHDAAKILGVAANKVNVRVKRMGGGFGGKELRFHVFTYPAVVAAHRCGKPIRCMLSRQEDMLMTGGRNPFLVKYKVGFMKTGKLVSIINQHYCNSGNTLDVSLSVLMIGMLHAESNYRIPNVKMTGYACRTNVPSNTAFRGFGRPQAILAAEDLMDQVAAFLKMPPEQLRQQNLLNESDDTFYGQTLENFPLHRCWKECMEKSNFKERKTAVESFNAKSRWRKRGICCTSTQHGIGYFPAKFLNQAGALVHIYRDGSVLLTHGGTEMGQGLHTKMIQVASQCLEIPISLVHISETSTNTVPNTTATSGSTASDLNGAAVKVACERIMNRLRPIKEANPDLSWTELVMKAYQDRVSLSANGFYKTPDLDGTWDFESGKISGKPFAYLACGVAVSEVEIDCLTGDHTLLRTDIVMDVGKSLNPTIDVGQVEGGFLQIYGMYTLEQPLYSPSGSLITRGPGAYKIPGFGDCPRQFHVHFVEKSENPKAIFSSKGVGEPSVCLAASAFFAIKHAISFARKDSGLSGWFQIDSPATAERIRMACGDGFTSQYSHHSKEEEDTDTKPWAIQV